MSSSTSGRALAQGIMDRVYAESPKFWPHGLGVSHFTPATGESVYLVREKQGSQPVGFVGWQVRKEAGRRIGYYSVGLLPEHRGCGYAKEAVRKLIMLKSAGVDEVKALVRQSNAPSLRLAEALGVEVVKTAAGPLTAIDTASTSAIRASANVDATAAKVNALIAELRGGARTAGLAAGGAGLGAVAGQLAIDELPEGHPNRNRNQRLRLLATLLGAGGGLAVDHYSKPASAFPELAKRFFPALRDPVVKPVKPKAAPTPAAAPMAPAAVPPLMKLAALLNKHTTKSAGRLDTIRALLKDPKTQSLLGNKAIQAGGGAIAGAGGAAVENNTWFSDSTPAVKGINLLSGALTGASVPFGKFPLTASLLTGKQLATAGLDVATKDAPIRSETARTNLSAANAANATANTNLATAKATADQAGKWTTRDKVMAALAGAGVLAAGTYAGNTLFGGKKKKKVVTDQAIRGDPNARRAQKIRIDVPAGAFPPEFLQSLVNADDRPNAYTHAKVAVCHNTRDEILADIAEDCAALS